MSRIGKKPVYLSSGVTVEVTNDELVVKGPKGELKRPMPSLVSIEQKDGDKGAYVNVLLDEAASNNAIWGTMRSHVANMVHGVSEGWEKALELNGVGFKMNLAGSKLTLALGFSHEIVYEIPADVDASIEGMILTIKGMNKESVGQTAAEIRAFKKPEPYKGKGFRYTDEIIRRKVGKAAKSE